MKMNENHKNNSSANTAETKTDQVSRKAVTVVEDIKVKHFDLDHTWTKIVNQLGKVDKQLVTWGLAMAASFSLLVAANIDMKQWGFPTDRPEVLPTPLSNMNTREAIKPIRRQAQSIPTLTHKTLPPVDLVTEKVNIPIHVESQNHATHPALTRDMEISGLQPIYNPFISVFAKANISTRGLAPELGLDIKIAENYTARRREIYKIGISSQLDVISNENGEDKIFPHTFLNLEFTSLNKKTNKGWTARAGYLLNPDGQVYQDTTIKLSLFRNVGKHLKIGPEVIFSDNMKQYYPGLSLILG